MLNLLTNFIFSPLLADFNDFFIYAFLSIGILIPAYKMNEAKSHVYAVLLFLISVLNQAGLLAFLGYEFFALAFLLIYAGAIVILYVFIIMLTPPDFFTKTNKPRCAGIIGFLLFTELICVLQRAFCKVDTNRFLIFSEFDVVDFNQKHLFLWFFQDGYTLGYLLFDQAAATTVLLAFIILVVLVGTILTAPNKTE